MNPMILTLLGLLYYIGGIKNVMGVVIGLTICYVMLDRHDSRSTIRYHLTHWSWTNWRV